MNMLSCGNISETVTVTLVSAEMHRGDEVNVAVKTHRSRL